ncbi:MAG: T9SS type A sorting domain-containing protein [Saprospiraceae bacterium]|uniref:T9SS type A sorting domain-containing protein n=1 Tax=Candidatus Opimibacter skivensis TaxID=2982028 RepID=A0A9D7XU43_9BACT|nr:T9SS type A sorting domain-containing protein [Candidatus Opimibacter skivensis]
MQTDLIVKLYYTTGQLIYSQIGKEAINVSEFPAGVYILKISDMSGRHSVVEKIVIVE